MRAYARTRGWDKLRLLSAGDSTFKYDLGSEDREGGRDSTISVFTRDADGTLRDFYSVQPRLAEDIKERGIDELTHPQYVGPDALGTAVGMRHTITGRRFKQRAAEDETAPMTRATRALWSLGIKEETKK